MTHSTTEIGYELIKELSVLAQGRTPILAPQGWAYGGAGSPPSSTGDGVDVEDAIVALVGVRLRQSVDRWRSYFRVDVATVGQSYGIAFGAALTTVTFVAATAVAADIIAGLKAALEADGTFTGAGGQCALVAGQASLLEVSFPAATSVAKAGTGTGSLVQEADQVAWRLWELPLGHDQWAVAGEFRSRVTRDAYELVPVRAAGRRRLYIEVLDADGAVLQLVAPGRRDDRADTLLEDSATQLATALGNLYQFPLTIDGGLAFAENLDGQVEVEGLAVPLIRQELVAVGLGGTDELLPFRPHRNGYLIRNLGAGAIYRRWVKGGVAAATDADLELASKEVDTRSGKVPREAMVAIADAGGPYNVWVEEW